MNILLISFIIITVNLAITSLIIEYFMDLILERLKAEEELDLTVKNNICCIYDIMKFNGLVRPAEKEKEEAEEVK